MSRLFFALAVAVFAAASFGARGATGADTAPGAQPEKADAAKPDRKPAMVKKRMKEKEPMAGEMKREGMMKEQVRTEAMKKNKMMEEAMQKEKMQQ